MGYPHNRRLKFDLRLNMTSFRGEYLEDKSYLKLKKQIVVTFQDEVEGIGLKKLVCNCL